MPSQRQQIALRLSDEEQQLFDACRLWIEETKESAGLDPSTTVSEVIRTALRCLDEKHGITKSRRSPRRAM